MSRIPVILFEHSSSRLGRLATLMQTQMLTQTLMVKQMVELTLSPGAVLPGTKSELNMLTCKHVYLPHLTLYL